MDLSIVILVLLPFTYAKENASKKRIVVDKEHLRMDFLEIFGSWASIFTDKEMDFRYFAAHDYDGNKKLDGLELFSALGHETQHHEDGEENQVEEEEHSVPEEIERQVDEIFQDHDTNNDGFLDYKEFMSVQRTYPDMNGKAKNEEI